MGIALIAAAFVSSVQVDFIRSAGDFRKTQAKAQINAYQTALGTYKSDTGILPTTNQGLQALRVKPENTRNWNGPYVQRDIGADPWNVYRYPGDYGDKPNLICYGADGKPGGEGLNADIVNWKN